MPAGNTNSTFPLPQDRGLFLPQPLGSSPKTRNEEPAGDQLLQWRHHRQSRPGLGDPSSLATVATAAEHVAIDSTGPSRGQMQRDTSSENTQRSPGEKCTPQPGRQKTKSFHFLAIKAEQARGSRVYPPNRENRILLLQEHSQGAPTQDGEDSPTAKDSAT